MPSLWLRSLLAALLLFHATFSLAAEPSWKAGFAKVNVTPEQPMWLAGYGGRDRPAEGKLHDVWVKTVALEDAAGKRVVLLTSDLCGIPRWMVDSISNAVEKKHGIDRAGLRLCYSHNHCAPVVRGDLEDYYPLDAEQKRRVDAFSDKLEKQMLDSIDRAIADLSPAKVSMAVGECTFAVNRRNNKEAEVPAMIERGEPFKGPVDHRVPVLAIHDASGEKLRGIVFAYACHNTTLSFYQWCGDYAGFAQIALERDHPGAMALFVTGCGGDQNPLPRRTVPLCEKYGEQLATGVNLALKRGTRELAPRTRTRYESVELAFERVMERAEFQKYADGADSLRKRWALRFLKMLDEGKPLPKSAPLAITAWKLGDLDWLSIGGETLVDYADRFRAEYGEATWVTSYSSDLLAYIPSRRNIVEGLYEGTNLYEYMHPAEKWALDTEQRIAGAVERLMAK